MSASPSVILLGHEGGVYARYGPPEVLRLFDIERPRPGDGQVLIKVRAVSVNASDWETLRGRPLYARIGGPVRPRFKILGSDVAGRVEAIGPAVTRFRPGDEVFGDNLALMGGFAEYVCAREQALAAKPAGLSFEEAAAIPQAGVIALQGIRRKGRVQPRQKVLVNGVGGGAGMFAVQLAKLAGAQVTGVDNAGKLDFVRSLGADQVVDYTRTDFTRTGEHYDLVLDLAAHRSAFDYRRALAANGRYLYVGGSVPMPPAVTACGFPDCSALRTGRWSFATSCAARPRQSPARCARCGSTGTTRRRPTSRRTSTLPWSPPPGPPPSAPTRNRVAGATCACSAPPIRRSSTTQASSRTRA